MRKPRRVWYRGYWCVVWYDEGNNRRRTSLHTKDEREADRLLKDFEKSPIGDDCAAIFDAYLKDLDARGKDSSRARNAWKALEGTFGAMRPDQVDRALCRSYTARRRRAGRKNGTIGKELDCLRSALRWKDKNTPAEFEMPPRPPPRNRRLSRTEYRRLRLAAKRGGLHLYVFVVLALATAGRKEAILDLTWDRIDFGRRQIQLASEDGRTRKGRATVPMTRHAHRVLRLARKFATTDWVVEYGGHKVGSIKRGFASACERAKLEDVTPHTLRHTAATWMAERGVTMAVIAQYLGHSDDRITQRVYARYSPDYLRDAAKALE